MTVNILRSEYGESPRRWWGDLSASETRALYHSLLPTVRGSGVMPKSDKRMTNDM